MTKPNKRLIAEGSEPNAIRRAFQRLDHRAKTLAASGIPFNGSDMAAELKALKARIEALENCIGSKIELEDGSGVLLKEDGDALLLDGCDLHQGEGFVDGASVVYISPASVTVGTAGQVSRLRNQSNGHTIQFLGTLSASLAASGAGGLDVGAEAAATWYAVHVIADSAGVNPVAAMFSKSVFTPTLPAGYNLSRRVGWVRNDSAADILPFVQLGTLRIRFTFYDTESVATRVLSAGAATVFTEVSCQEFVPVSARFVGLRADFTPKVAGNEFKLRAKGSTVVDPLVQSVGVIANKQIAALSDVYTSADQKVEYKVSNALDSVDLFVMRYSDQL